MFPRSGETVSQIILDSSQWVVFISMLRRFNCFENHWRNMVFGFLKITIEVGPEYGRVIVGLIGLEQDYFGTSRCQEVYRY